MRWRSPNPCSRRSARGSAVDARRSSSPATTTAGSSPRGCARRAHGWRPTRVVPVDATPALARVTSWLAPARVRVHYPGVWLSDRVWATHGHYLDRHLLPTSAFGIARGLLGRLPREEALPVDYEQAGGPSVTRVEAWLTRWLPRPLATMVEDLAELLRAATMPRVPKPLLHRRMAPLLAAVLGMQMRRASIPALARVVYSLGVDADWVLFGHVHRLGPLDGDIESQWQGIAGRPRIVNTGSWVYEPLLLHRAAPDHPYWPGGAVLLEDGSDPQADRACSTTSPAQSCTSRSGQHEVAVAELVPQVPARQRRVVGAREQLRTRGRLEHLQVRRLGLVPAGDQAVDHATAHARA